MVEPPRTRSELLAARRAESSFQLQSRYDAWESQNPAWARRLTGPAAAAALGYIKQEGDPVGWNSRSEMMHARKTTSREAAMRASGFDRETQKKLTSFELDALTTSLARDCADPSTTWVEAPGGPNARYSACASLLLG